MLHDYLRDTLELGYNKCKSCRNRTQFTYMQCGFCDSCHWKKERVEKIKQSHQLKQKLLRYTVKKQNRDQQFIIVCLSCCYLLQHVYQSYAPDSLSCSFTPHPISLDNIGPTRDSTDNSVRSLIFS
jgi:hypothetical protein